MSICSECGADFEGAFCPNCGALNPNASRGRSPQTSSLGAEDDLAQDANANNPYAVGSQTSHARQEEVQVDDVPDIPSFGEAFNACCKKCRQFGGRASRSEFWFLVVWQAIFYCLAYEIVVRIFDALGGKTAPSFAYFLTLPFICSPHVISATARRLHDSGRSGAWIFIVFLPVVGVIILAILLALPPTQGPNRFGLQPRRREKKA